MRFKITVFSVMVGVGVDLIIMLVRQFKKTNVA